MRRLMKLWWLSAGLLGLAAPAQGQSLSQSALDALARDMGYRFEVVSNRPETCPQGMSSCFLSTITLTMPETFSGNPGDLALYFSFVSRLPVVESEIFAHQLVNGDLQRLTLRPGARLAPGARYTVKLWGLGNHFSTAFAMPNAYLAVPGLEARTIEASRPAIDPETGLETLPFVAPMTDEAKLATAGADDETRWLTPGRAFDLYAARQAKLADDVAIVPLPATIRRSAGSPVDLTRGVALALEGVERSAIEPALGALADAGAGGFNSGPALRVTVDSASGIASEGYRLDAVNGAIAIRASDAAGASNALRSLAQQVAFEKGRLRPVAIEDAPRYGFRGLHIDLGRNFHSKTELLKLVEAMAAYKLNKLHLHLADDEGWRLEIAALPELAEIGGKRCHDPSERTCLLPQLGAGPEGTGPVNGYLTRADYVEIVRAARARHIEVIPSIDMPGHSRAAIRAMEARFARRTAEGKPEEAALYRLVDPQDTTRYRSIQNYDDNTLNVCLPATYRFIDTVVDAIAALHREAGAPLETFHLGADETAGAWTDSPACEPLLAELGIEPKALTPYFIEKVAARLAEKGYRTAGWSDGMGHTNSVDMPRDAQTNIWGVLHNNAVAEAHDQANRGWDVVLSIPDLGYFDMPYAPHPLEGGYDWATRGVDSYQVFGFMTGNLPANAATIRNIKAKYQPIADKPALEPRREFAGIQAQLWSETIRTDAAVDYMFFPRLLALAERAWRKPEWAPAYQPGAVYEWRDKRIDHAALLSDWRDFAGRVAAQLPMLDRAGIAYRLAPPGARITGGRLEANTEFPGTMIEYRVRGGEWRRYTAPVEISASTELRTRTPDGKRASRTVTVSPAGR